MTFLDPDARVAMTERVEGNLAKFRLLQGGNKNPLHHVVVLCDVPLRGRKHEVVRVRRASELPDFQFVHQLVRQIE